MRNTPLLGMVLTSLVAGWPVCAQTSGDELTQLNARVVRLEKQVQEMSRLRSLSGSSRQWKAAAGHCGISSLMN